MTFPLWPAFKHVVVRQVRNAGLFRRASYILGEGLASRMFDVFRVRKTPASGSARGAPTSTVLPRSLLQVDFTSEFDFNFMELVVRLLSSTSDVFITDIHYIPYFISVLLQSPFWSNELSPWSWRCHRSRISRNSSSNARRANIGFDAHRRQIAASTAFGKWKRIFIERLRPSGAKGRRRCQGREGESI